MKISTSSNSTIINNSNEDSVFSLNKEIVVPSLTFLTPLEQAHFALTNKKIFSFLMKL